MKIWVLTVKGTRVFKGKLCKNWTIRQKIAYQARNTKILYRFEGHTVVLDIFDIKCNVAVMLEMDKFVKASKRNNIQKVKFSCEHPGFLTFHAILFNLSIKSSFSPSPCSCLCPAGSSPSASSPWTPPSTTCRRRLCRCGQTQRIPFECTNFPEKRWLKCIHMKNNCLGRRTKLTLLLENVSRPNLTCF